MQCARCVSTSQSSQIFAVQSRSGSYRPAVRNASRKSATYLAMLGKTAGRSHADEVGILTPGSRSTMAQPSNRWRLCLGQRPLAGYAARVRTRATCGVAVPLHQPHLHFCAKRVVEVEVTRPHDPATTPKHYVDKDNSKRAFRSLISESDRHADEPLAITSLGHSHG
jgi:hypothetical protein